MPSVTVALLFDETKTLMKLNQGILLASVLAVTVGLAGCGNGGSGGGGGTVATVNGESITASEFNNYLRIKSSATVSSPQNPQERNVALNMLANNMSPTLPTNGTIGMQALNEMIRRKLILQMAKEEGVMPSDEDVTAEIKHRTDLQDSYVNQLNGAGYTLAMIKDQVLLELAELNILTKGIEVSDSDVDNLIKERPELTVDPAKAEVIAIAVGSQASRQRADAELAKGRQFEEVAKEINDDPQLLRNGGAMTLPMANDDKVAAALKATDINKMTGWIDVTPEGGQQSWIRFFVKGKTVEKEIEMTPARKLQVRRQIAQQRGREGKDIGQRLNDALLDAEITVSDETLKKPWESFAAQLKQQRATRSQSQTSGNAPTTNEGN